MPVFENCETDTMKSIYGLIRPSCEIQLDFVKGYDVSRARNMAVKEAFDYGFTHLFFVDSDIVLPPDALINLYKAEKDVILGWYRRKRTVTNQTEIFKLGIKDFKDENNYNAAELAKEDIVQIKGGGMGCALINMEVFKRMGEKRWFQYIEYDNGWGDVLSEDNFFCVECEKINIPIFVHGKVQCGHISKITL